MSTSALSGMSLDKNLGVQELKTINTNVDGNALKYSKITIETISRALCDNNKFILKVNEKQMLDILYQIFDKSGLSEPQEEEKIALYKRFHNYAKSIFGPLPTGMIYIPTTEFFMRLANICYYSYNYRNVDLAYSMILVQWYVIVLINLFHPNEKDYSEQQKAFQKDFLEEIVFQLSRTTLIQKQIALIIFNTENECLKVSKKDFTELKMSYISTHNRIDRVVDNIVKRHEKINAIGRTQIINVLRPYLDKVIHSSLKPQNVRSILDYVESTFKRIKDEVENFNKLFDLSFEKRGDMQKNREDEWRKHKEEKEVIRKKMMKHLYEIAYLPMGEVFNVRRECSFASIPIKEYFEMVSESTNEWYTYEFKMNVYADDIKEFVRKHEYALSYSYEKIFINKCTFILKKKNRNGKENIFMAVAREYLRKMKDYKIQVSMTDNNTRDPYHPSLQV